MVALVHQENEEVKIEIEIEIEKETRGFFMEKIRAGMKTVVRGVEKVEIKKIILSYFFKYSSF